MAIVGRMEKQPTEVLDYDLDFSGWIPSGDYIASVTATVATGLTIDSFSFFSQSWVKVWLSGGTNGQTYKVEVTVTTYDGRVKQAEFYVKVKEV